MQSCVAWSSPNRGLEEINMQAKKDISCIVLVYENLNVIFESISFMIKYNDRMDIHVIENRSSTSSMTSPYFQALVSGGQINSYILFNGNVTNNAYDVILRDHDELFGNEFTIVSDGDVVADEGWLDESIAILRKHQDVFCCSVRMKTDGWNEKVKAGYDALPRKQHSDYIESPSGIWLCAFRSDELRAVTRALRDSSLRFRDAYLHAYSSKIMGKKWVTTIRASAQELNRSLYSDSGYINRKNKNISDNYSGDHYKFWGHDDLTDYKVYRWDGFIEISPLPLPPSRPNVESIETDEIVRKLNASSDLSCWIDVDRAYARSGWVNVGRFGPKSFYTAATNTYHVACDISSHLPPFEDIFGHVFCYWLLGRFDPDGQDRLVQFIASCVAKGGNLRIVDLDIQYLTQIASSGEEDNLAELARSTPVLRRSGDIREFGSDLLEYWQTKRGRRMIDQDALAEQLRRRGFIVELGRGDPALDPNGALSRFCWSLTARRV